MTGEPAEYLKIEKDINRKISLTLTLFFYSPTRPSFFYFISLFFLYLPVTHLNLSSYHHHYPPHRYLPHPYLPQQPEEEQLPPS